MVKRTIYTLLAVLFGLNAQAQQVTEYDALQKAKQFLSNKSFSMVSKTRGSSEKDRNGSITNAEITTVADIIMGK